MPEKFIWRVGIALHCLPRLFLFPPIIHKHYKETQSGRRYNLTTWWFGLLNLLNCISQVVENGALLTLTYISSTDNFGKLFHPTCMFTEINNGGPLSVLLMIYLVICFFFLFVCYQLLKRVPK